MDTLFFTFVLKQIAANMRTSYYKYWLKLQFRKIYEKKRQNKKVILSSFLVKKTRYI